MDYEFELNDIRNRINRLLKDKGLTENAVAAGNSPAQKRLNNQLSHGGNLTLDTILRISAACPDISLDWLLRGCGDMVVSANTAVTGANNVTGQNATVIGQQTLSEDFVNRLLQEKDKQIQALLNIIGK